MYPISNGSVSRSIIFENIDPLIRLPPQKAISDIAVELEKHREAEKKAPAPGETRFATQRSGHSSGGRRPGDVILAPNAARLRWRRRRVSCGSGGDRFLQ